MPQTKATIVGDGAVGKTSLLSRVTNNVIDWSNDYPYEPVTFNNYRLQWEAEDGGVLDLELWDTAGQEGFEQLRALCYPGTDIFLIAYDINSLISLNNVQAKWCPEIKQMLADQGYVEEPWIVMVGTKKDLSTDEGASEEAKAVAESIDACGLIITSAKTNEGVSELESKIMELAFIKADGKPRPKTAVKSAEQPSCNEGPFAAKVVSVGDGATGKSCLIERLRNNAIYLGYDTNSYDPVANFQLEWGDLAVELWDTAGQEGFEQLRALEAYPGTDIFLITYDTNTTTSLTNIQAKWLPEIKIGLASEGDSNEPWIIMLGTKADLCTNEVTVEQAKAVAESINACSLITTSAMTDQGVDLLKARIKELALMKAKGAPRPNLGTLSQIVCL